MHDTVDIRQVAHAAGVSTATVSRVMTGRVPVGAATRERVLDAAHRLRYVPSAVGRGLRTDRTMAIAVLVPDLGNPVFAPFLRGVHDVSQVNGYAVLVADSQQSKSVERQVLDRLHAQRVDALVLAGAARNRDQVRALRDAGLLVADFTLDMSAQGSVDQLEAPGTQAMCEAIAALGHRGLTYAHPNHALGGAGRRRWQAISRHCRRLGVGAERMSMGGNRDPQTVAAMIRDRLERPDPMTALVASTHGLAPTLLRGLAVADVDLPGQCSFVTYGDSDWASAYRPSISVVTADLYLVGRTMTDSVVLSLRRHLPTTSRQIAEPAVLPPAQFIHRASLDQPPQ